MGPLISVMTILPLIGFWFWMYHDMTNNVYLTNREKDTWTLYFIFLNVFAAILYYVYQYRPRH